MTWLITGGAGYIGGHVVRSLTGAGVPVVVLDDLSSGGRDRLPAGVPLEVGSTLDPAAVERVLSRYPVRGVLHIAAKKQPAESVAEPLRYYRENVEGMRTVLSAAVAAGVRRVLFSSSAAVYGMPHDVELVTESTPCAPLNPYGETKLAGEWLLAACAQAYGISGVSLRYFNVAGTATAGLADRGAANLVPMVFQRLTEGRAPLVFGTDYPTPDGSCVRDYIHVADVASAHLAAVRHLDADPEPGALTLNVGRGEGVSVLEMLDVIARVTGRRFTPETAPRRPGDPAKVVASADRIRAEFGWSAEHDVESMVASAWQAWLHHNPRARTGH